MSGGGGHLLQRLQDSISARVHANRRAITPEDFALWIYDEERALAEAVDRAMSALRGGGAHVKVADAEPMVQSHYRFQIRTFWIGLLYLAIGIPLCLVLIGIPILAWWFIWSLIRIAKGILLVNEHKPIANPGSWLFG